jgi:type 1 glutamine amidotransferase
MRTRHVYSVALCCLAVFVLAEVTLAQVDPQRAEKIRAAAPERASVAPKKARTVLIWNTPPALMDKDPHKGYCIPFGECAFQTLGEKTGAFKPVVSGDLAMFAPGKIKQFDAIVMNNSSGPWIQPVDVDMERLKPLGSDKQAVEKLLRKSLLDYVSGGGGIVACHFAIGANPQWPEFRDLLGAKFTGHPWNEEVGIKNEEPGHPLLAAFGGKDFRLADEIYQFGDPYSRKDLRVLLSLDTKTTNMNVKWIDRKDGDFALAWVKRHGQGRIFYCGFGHRTEIWWNSVVLRFYLDGIQFAVGDLAAPTEPR